ncbi:hypothetical protein KKH3_07290 [Pectobacterium actinidiae]|nr:hypothetical protein KKH3_07290 [Pectobacterium actinidiae]
MRAACFVALFTALSRAGLLNLMENNATIALFFNVSFT